MGNVKTSKQSSSSLKSNMDTQQSLEIQFIVMTADKRHKSNLTRLGCNCKHQTGGISVFLQTFFSCKEPKQLFEDQLRRMEHRLTA